MKPSHGAGTRGPAVAAVVIGSALLGACGDGGTTAPAPRTGATVWTLPSEQVAVASDDALEAAAWPDACALGAGADLTGPTPESGQTPQGEPLPGARECTWTAPDGSRVSLRVTIVTLDVLEAWAGYRYTATLRREVTGLATEAFLVPAAPDQADVLWVCEGLTIFTVETDGPPGEASEQVMYDAAEAAVLHLGGTPAGARPQLRPEDGA